jgi:hypothetical protein
MSLERKDVRAKRRGRQMIAYAPKPGSVADYVLRRLREPAAPERISQLSIQRALGKPQAACIWQSCERAVDYGLLERVNIEGRTYYSLPERERIEAGARVMAWVARQAVTEIRIAA